MGYQTRLATRPTVTGNCTCLWQEKQEDKSLVPAAAGIGSSALHSVGSAVISAIYPPVHNSQGHVPGGYPIEKRTFTSNESAPGLFAGSTKPHARLDETRLAPALRPSSFYDRSSQHGSAQNLVLYQPHHARESGRAKEEWVSRNKPLTDRAVPDLLVRRIKKNLRKSSEHKLRELVSYKAELLNCLRTLVPKHVAPDSPNANLRAVQDILSTSHSDFDKTWLCLHCLTQLKTYLYYSPTARSPYLYEHSVPAYLSLLDDAVSAVNSNCDMEYVTHHELSSILIAELSVVEWRLSLKLARFHRKTGYLGVFPMEVGDYANLEIKRSLNKPEDGLLTIIWKKIRGFGAE